MEELKKKIQMVKITPFEYIVINRISDKVTHVMMPIIDSEINEVTRIFNINKKNELYRTTINIGNFVVDSGNIVMYGKSDSDLPRVEGMISSIIDGIIGAPGHINKDTLEVSIEMVCGCTTKRFYNYYLTLIGNPKNIIIFKHYGTFN